MILKQQSSVLKHSDSSPPKVELDLLSFQRLKHAPYSPDLAPLDFAIFPCLKSQLRGHRFENLHELKQETNKVFRQLLTSWFTNVYNKWVVWHQKCTSHPSRVLKRSNANDSDVLIHTKVWAGVL